MIYLKDAPIDWHPRNKPDKWVPATVVEDQRTEQSAVVFRLSGNQQLLSMPPDLVRPRGNWDGHEWDPNGRLGAKPVPPGPLVEMPLPDRLAYAAEQAIDEARVCGVTNGNQPVYVEGYLADFAKAAAAVVLEVLAGEMEAHDGAGHAALLRMLANSVREVA